MKKCPNCQKTYDDTLKFCQVDGTPLVAVAEDTPEENPYKTTVGNKADLPIPPEDKKPEPEPEPEPEIDPFATMVAGSGMPPPKEEDVLEVPDTSLDPMATMVVSGQTAGKIEIDIPEEEAAPAEETAPEPVAETPAVESSAPAEETPSPPQSPAFTPPPVEERPSAPIPSPFDESMPPGFAPPTTPPFETPGSPVESEQVVASVPAEPESLPTDFADVEEVSVEIGEVEPAVPAMSDAGQIEASGSESLSTAEGSGPNQTLAFVSLALGVIGLPCCAFYIFGLGAIVVGFIARGRANSDPENYGGGTYATIGLVLGFVSVLLGTALLIFQLLLGGLANFM